MTSGAIVFIDRDGVLNELVVDPSSGKPESPYAARDVRLMPQAVAGIRALRRLDVPIAVVSNQPAAAKGRITVASLREVHDEVDRLLHDAGISVDAYRYCFHHPAGADPTLSVACDCRKPAPGMLLDAAGEVGVRDLSGSWMIGDSDVDVLAGRAAGCRTILIEEPASAHRRGHAEPDARAADLYEAARIVAAAFASTGVVACSTR
jgi:D-glycero-D-manno-heptose 1,7-bisphosphate phosphatase